MNYFYYIRTNHGNLSPRMCLEWPPVGGEPNVVAWKKEITEEEATFSLATLDSIYRKEAEADLSQ